MSDDKVVMLTFMWIAVTADIIIMLLIEIGILSSGQHFVRIRLMGYIIDNLVLW